jgi:hypothetical protein
MKSDKTKQNSKEKLRRAQNQHRSSKKYEKLKLKVKAKNQHKNSRSTLPRKSTPPNTLNAISPPYIVIYHVSSLNHPVSKESN